MPATYRPQPATPLTTASTTVAISWHFLILLRSVRSRSKNALAANSLRLDARGSRPIRRARFGAHALPAKLFRHLRFWQPGRRRGHKFSHLGTSCGSEDIYTGTGVRVLMHNTITVMNAKGGVGKSTL